MLDGRALGGLNNEPRSSFVRIDDGTSGNGKNSAILDRELV